MSSRIKVCTCSDSCPWRLPAAEATPDRQAVALRRGNRSVRGASSGELRERVAAGVGGDEVAEVSEQGAVLKAAGAGGGECPLGESFAAL